MSEKTHFVDVGKDEMTLTCSVALGVTKKEFIYTDNMMYCPSCGELLDFKVRRK